MSVVDIATCEEEEEEEEEGEEEEEEETGIDCCPGGRCCVDTSKPDISAVDLKRFDDIFGTLCDVYYESRNFFNCKMKGVVGVNVNW